MPFFRSTYFEKKPQNMVSAIEQNILNGFALCYTTKAKIETQILQRNIFNNASNNQYSIMDYKTPKKVDFSQYQRCILEDFMELKQNTHVYVVTLSDYPIACDKKFPSVRKVSVQQNIIQSL